MKKVFIVLCASVLTTLSMVAENTASITIKISAPSNAVDKMYLRENPEFATSTAYNADKVATYNTPQKVNIYALNGGAKFEKLGLANLEGTYIGVIPNRADEQYIISFPEVSGRALKFVDHMGIFEGGQYKDSIMDITTEVKYQFSMEKGNVEHNTRFQILKSFTPDEGTLEVCHIGENLEIRNNPYAKNIVVKNEVGEVVIDKVPQLTKPNPQLISLKELEAGRYTVEFNEGAEVFVIAVKPEVIPVP